MAEARAKEFVHWLANNPDQRTKLLNAEPGQRRQLMQQAGFGDVDAQEVESILHPSGAHDLSDEQLRSIQGGLRQAAIIWD